MILIKWIHFSGLKPYKCEQCEKTFCERGGVAKHFKAVHLGLSQNFKLFINSSNIRLMEWSGLRSESQCITTWGCKRTDSLNPYIYTVDG